MTFDRVANQLMGFSCCRTRPAGSRSAAAFTSTNRAPVLLSLSVTGMSQAKWGDWLGAHGFLKTPAVVRDCGGSEATHQPAWPDPSLQKDEMTVH